MKTYHFYLLSSGLFTGCSFSGARDMLEQNTPADCGAHEAPQVDFLSQRLDLESGKLVDYQPPQPSSDHEWDTVTRRWQLNAARAKAEFDDMEARAEIDRLEQQQARRVRELLLKNDPQLKALDDQIAGLRPKLLPKKNG